MAALNTTGLAQGLAQGIGIARDYARDRMEQERYAQQQAIDAEKRRMDQERYLTEQRRLMAQDRATAQYRQDSLAYDRQRTEATQASSRASQDADRARIASYERDALKPEGEAYLYNSLNSSSFTPDAALEERLRKAGLGRYIPSTYLDDQRNIDAYRLYGMGKSIMEGGVELSEVNSPQFVNLFNSVFGDQVGVNVGEVDPQSGKTIKSKEVAGFEMGPNGFVTNLRVRYEDGSESTQPVTRDRSANPNDPVRVSTPDDLVGMVVGRAQMAQIFQNEDVKGRLKGAYDMVTRDTRGQTPAAVQTIEYFQSLGLGPREAVEMYKGNGMQRQEAVMSLYETLYKAAMEAKVGAEQLTEPERNELMTQAQSVVASVYGSTESGAVDPSRARDAAAQLNLTMDQ